MSNPLHVACSPITSRVFCGSVSKDGTTWLANKTDVTGEACAAVAHHALARGGEVTVTENGSAKYVITVREATDTAAVGNGEVQS